MVRIWIAGVSIALGLAGCAQPDLSPDLESAAGGPAIGAGVAEEIVDEPVVAVGTVP